MELKTAEKKKFKNVDEFLSEILKVINNPPNPQYQKAHLIDLINTYTKEYASQAVRLALEEAGELVASRTAQDHKGNNMGAWIDKSSILSLADSIIGKLK